MECVWNIINKYKYFFILLVGFIFQFSILLTITIYLYSTRNKYIWFNSKILSIKNILKDNYMPYKIFQEFDEEEIHYYHALKFSYYDLLKNSTKDNCSKDLKQCGILDTYGNKLCLYKDYPCPINEIKTDLESKYVEYNKKGYRDRVYHLLKKEINGSIYSFYYKNTSINNNIITSLLYTEKNPTFIGAQNFIFDSNAFEKKYNYKIKNLNLTFQIFDNNINQLIFNNKNIDDLNLTTKIQGFENEILNWSDVSETKVYLLKTSNLEKYIDDKIYDNNNIDTNYTKIFDKIYIKNFVGFEDSEQMDKFYNTNFEIYKKIFPYNIRLGVVILSEILIFIFVVIYIRKLFEDEEDERKQKKREEIKKRNGKKDTEKNKITNKEEEKEKSSEDEKNKITNEEEEEKEEKSNEDEKNKIANEEEEEKEKSNEDENKNTCKKYENFLIIWGISIYSFSFLYFFIQFSASLYELNKNNKFSYLKTIKADKHIEDFIKEFLKIYNKKGLISCCILFFSISFICYLLALLFYIEKLNKEKIENEIEENQYAPSIPEEQKNVINVQKKNQIRVENDFGLPSSKGEFKKKGINNNQYF